MFVIALGAPRIDEHTKVPGPWLLPSRHYMPISPISHWASSVCFLAWVSSSLTGRIVNYILYPAFDSKIRPANRSRCPQPASD